ncbi:MAG: ASKHA domain-containing protein [Lachnospiraceae bacterium]|nr:ASKHA domain-containing protein [Lachnospiraceae bacterium]
MSCGISRKLFLELDPPTEEDNRSSWQRICDSLREKGCEDVKASAFVLRKLYPLCEEAGWKLTISLCYDGKGWDAVDLEAGDTSDAHYGFAVDLGSTTVVMQLIHCNTGEVVAQESAYNQQIAFGEDILTRIFYAHERDGGLSPAPDAGEQKCVYFPCPAMHKTFSEHLEELRLATVDTIIGLMERIAAKTGIDTKKCLSMTVAGNTTMIHFLIGMDAFCVFSAPYAVQADQPGFLRGEELDIPIRGYVFCYPGKANYLGGDIISGMVATDLYHRESISLFFDVGTNGELVVGNRDFLLCGAGAAGPALEGGVVKTGMRAADGAVQHICFTYADPSPESEERAGQEQTPAESLSPADTYSGRKNQETIIIGRNTCTVQLDVIGGGMPTGICGSGIIDLISELFLHGLIDLRGKFVPESSDAITFRPQEGEYAFCYAPGLWFYQSDIQEFIRTKAAAYTMMEYLLSETGLELEEVTDFYMAGAFGTHVKKESAVNIGMYPDVDPERIHAEGNTSLKGARMLLLNRDIAEELPEILDRMTYVQFGAVEDFLQKMTAASALPHTDLERYPSVKARLAMFHSA